MAAILKNVKTINFRTGGGFFACKGEIPPLSYIFAIKKQLFGVKTEVCFVWKDKQS